MNHWNNGFRPRSQPTLPSQQQGYPQQQYSQQQHPQQQHAYPRLTERMQAPPQGVIPQQAWPQQPYPAPTITNAPASAPATPSPANPYCVAPEQRDELHILAAIINGTGVPNPRKLGVGALVTAAIALGVNLVFILAFERYYIWLAVIPAPLLLCGAFMAITNQPRVAQGVRPAQWVRFALAILAIIGLFGSFTFVRFLSGR